MSPFYLASQVTRFLTLFVERSGSTYMATVLDSHPEVVALREELAVLRQKGGGGAEQLAWAREFWTPSLVGRTRARGFKTKVLDILDPQGFADLLHQHEVKIVTLRRRNTVKAAVSTINARRLHEKSGRWNLLDESDRMPAFEVDMADFAAQLEMHRAWDQEVVDYAARLALPQLSLFYEDMLQDEQSFFSRIFDFLEVKPKPVQGKTYKNTSDNLRDVVLNFDALREAYAGTPFAPMFDEVVAA